MGYYNPNDPHERAQLALIISMIGLAVCAATLVSSFIAGATQ